jgi:2-hydroxycyclohexanecarboxyl-CoA dehydrogenase
MCIVRKHIIICITCFPTLPTGFTGILPAPPRKPGSILEDRFVRGLEGKTAIVTGGGQGIGKAIALRLAAEGCNVAIFDLKPETAEATAKEATGGKVRVYGVDVGERAAVDAAVAKVGEDFGPVWLLVNNAGWDKPMPFLKTDRDLWDKIIRINLYGPLNMHHAVCPAMVANGGGRVVNIASDAARVGTSDEAVYSACKGGLIAFTKSVARELARKNVLLNAVCPGPTNTPMMTEVLGAGDDAMKWKDAMVRGIPLKRMGEPEDYAGIVAFLASEDGSFITGQTVSVSGGMNMI